MWAVSQRRAMAEMIREREKKHSPLFAISSVCDVHHSRMCRWIVRRKNEAMSSCLFIIQSLCFVSVCTAAVLRKLHKVASMHGERWKWRCQCYLSSPPPLQNKLQLKKKKKSLHNFSIAVHTNRGHHSETLITAVLMSTMLLSFCIESYAYYIYIYYNSSDYNLNDEVQQPQTVNRWWDSPSVISRIHGTRSNVAQIMAKVNPRGPGRPRMYHESTLSHRLEHIWVMFWYFIVSCSQGHFTPV